MKRGTPRHVKTERLMRELKCSRVTAVGLLESIWHFASELTPQGDIGRYGDDDIAAWVGWNGDANKMISALINSGWVDYAAGVHRLVVHDWLEHCTEGVKKYLARHELAPIEAVVQTCRDTGKTCQGNAVGAGVEVEDVSRKGDARGKPDFPPEIDTPEMRVAWADYEQHRREKKDKLTPLATKKALNKLAKMGTARAIAALEHSIANGWTGIFEPDERKSHASRNPIPAGPGQKYDGSPLGKF